MKKALKDRTDYSVLVPSAIRGLNKQQKNLLGFLIQRHNTSSNYRHENDNWFYVTQDEMLLATGIASKNTLNVYVSLFIINDLLEKRQGGYKVASHYRLREKCNVSLYDTENPVTSTNCNIVQTDNQATTKIIATQNRGNEGENEKNCNTVHSENERVAAENTSKNCNHIYTYTHLYKENSNLTITNDSISNLSKNNSNLMEDNVYISHTCETDTPYWMADPQNDRPECEPYQYDYTNEATASVCGDNLICMCVDTMNDNTKTTQTTMNDNTKTTQTTMNDSTARSKFWKSWRRYKDNFATLNPEDAERHYGTYQRKLATLYDGDKLTSFVESLQRQYDYMCRQRDTIEENHSTLYVPQNFETPEWITSIYSELNLKAANVKTRQLLRQCEREPKLSKYVSKYRALCVLTTKKRLMSMYTDIDKPFMIQLLETYWNKPTTEKTIQDKQLIYDERYILTQAEMNELIADLPDSIELDNTGSGGATA